MYSAFTPNGDGLNDIFRVPESVPCKEVIIFQVFNRWGELVFSYGENGIGWDGTWRGKMQETGVYIYRVELFCEGEVRKQFTGTVTPIPVVLAQSNSGLLWLTLFRTACGRKKLSLRSISCTPAWKRPCLVSCFPGLKSQVIRYKTCVRNGRRTLLNVTL